MGIKYIWFLCSGDVSYNLAKLTTSGSFFVDLLGFSAYPMLWSVKKDTFTFLFQLVYSLSSCLSALPRTSGSMLNRNDKSRHPCFILDLVPSLNEKAFTFSPLGIMLAVGFLLMLFIRLREFPFVPGSFCREYMWISSNVVSISIEMMIF